MRKVILVIVALLVLGGAFVILKPKPVKSPSTQSTTTSTTNQTSTKVFELVVKDHKLISGSDTIRVTEGDDVTIKITVNEDEELHLHGYDISTEIEKDKPAELHFAAKLTGNFPFELEKSKTDLGAVQVLPK